MHVVDVARRFLGGTGIVAAAIPHAVGAALAAHLEDAGGIAVSFFGEGATGAGIAQEAFNVAAAQHLPILFVCENNLWQDHTPTKIAAPAVTFDRFGSGHCMLTDVVDGNDVLAVRSAAARLIERLRAGEGPAFLEARTYLTHFHAMWAASREDGRRVVPAPYRPDEGTAHWATASAARTSDGVKLLTPISRARPSSRTRSIDSSTIGSGCRAAGGQCSRSRSTYGVCSQRRLASTAGLTAAGAMSGNQSLVVRNSSARAMPLAATARPISGSFR